ncbi:MAG: protein translocase subunit SecD [Bacteroidia bacterium]|nr:protein translocase subunit SecD [Bacteroidia bacterium]
MFRIILILAFIAFSGYLLYPTWMDAGHQKSLSTLTGADSAKYYDDNEESIRDNREKRLKLGLDLQGGMYVTMEVDVIQLLEKLARNQDEILREILAETRNESKTSDESVLDIFGRKFDERNMRLSRYYGNIRDANSDVMTYLKDESEKAVERAVEIIRNRIDQYGVSEVSITRSGTRRIILELPGVSDEREVRGLIQETAQLEFKLLTDPQVYYSVLENIDKVLLGKTIDAAGGDSTLAAVDSAAAVAAADSADAAKRREDSLASATMTDEQRVEKFRQEHPFMALLIGTQSGYFATEEQKTRISNILNREDVRKVIPEDVSFAWGAKPITFDDGTQAFQLYSLKARPELTGEVITDARAQIDQGGLGANSVVTMQMDAEGSREWARVTGANVDKQIAIVLDNAVFSAPVVRQKIIGGNSQIDGMENMEEARLLEIVLKAGALPAPVEIIEERTVGPSLGEDSISKGVNSFAIGLILVLVFMVVYYQFGGVPADIAVMFNVVFILAILAGFRGTLTLPGIAGILLTVGMAVDANVLINERIREEFGAGKTMRAALEAGYSRAFPAIIDSNLTTLLTCLILYQFGSGPVQGFALTLMIGIVCSLFTAIIMTRVIFELTLDSSPNLVKLG